VGALKEEAAVSRGTPKLGPLQRREVALAALVDERTLARALRGDPVRPSVHERIRRALESRGIANLISNETAR